MANNLDATFRKLWAASMQHFFTKINVFSQITSNKYASDLFNGRTLSRPYYTGNDLQVYTRGADLTEQAVVTTEQTLTVNKEFGDLEYFDKFDDLQTAYNHIKEFTDIVARKLSNQIDADCLGEVINATSLVDGGDVTGGTAGDGIALTVTTWPEMLSKAKSKILKQDVAMTSEAYIVISPDGEGVAFNYGISRETSMGDGIMKNGLIGRSNGFKVFVSNNLTGSQTLGFATDWTAADTITINGVVLTAAASPSAAGDIDVAGTADATRALIAEFINAGGATSSSGEYVALSDANQILFRNLSAVNDDTANTLTVYGRGIPELAVSETLTDATDAWDADKANTHFMAAAEKNAVTLVVQSNPSMQINQAQKRKGRFVVSTVLYGLKTFDDGAKKMCNIAVKQA